MVWGFVLGKIDFEFLPSTHALNYVVVKQISIQTIIYFVHLCENVYIKPKVYSEDNTSLPQLKARIILEFEELKTENTLESVHEHLIRRVHLCMQYGGQHFQQFLH